MAKKVVATLKTGESKNLARAIKMVKSSKSGAYIFKEAIVSKELANNFFEKK